MLHTLFAPMMAPATCELCGNWLPGHNAGCPRDGVHPSQWTCTYAGELLSDEETAYDTVHKNAHKNAHNAHNAHENQPAMDVDTAFDSPPANGSWEILVFP
ncbi:hypothetical protein BDF14DRAFT_1792894 [Spinellus fusiger]|nr:hypothetical protein BDF14DRAFT_1792894 [Spinellus fusiger]